MEVRSAVLKPAVPGCNGLENRQQEAPPDRFLRKLKEEKVDGGDQDQGAGHSQDHLALHPVLFEMQPVGADIFPG